MKGTKATKASKAEIVQKTNLAKAAGL